VLIAVLVLAGACPPALADAAAGRKAAVKCQPCHGIDGLSKLPEAPNIAGQPEPYLVAQLNAYRTGARSNELMSTMAKTLSEQEIADLAQWYAGIEVTATVPPQ
jgi:cytochrome c553